MRLNWKTIGITSREGSRADAATSRPWASEVLTERTGLSRATEWHGRLCVYGCLHHAATHGTLTALRINPAASQDTQYAGILDLAVRIPTMLGLRTVEVTLRASHPYLGQTHAFAVQQCIWCAMDGSALAAFLDLGYLVNSVAETSVELRWRNPTM